MADGWRQVFKSSRLVPPPSQTVRLAAERHCTRSEGFQLSLGRLIAAHQPEEVSDLEQDLTYQLRVTLFDRNHQQFFGKTWKSSPQRMKNNKISFNEVLYFHTSLRLPSTMVVLELVSLSPRPDGSQQALGRGFTVLELFTNRPEAPTADGDRRPAIVCCPLEYTDSSLLKTIDGKHLICVVKSHPALVSMMHLLPENVLVSGDENIPGLAASPAGDALLRPQLLKMLPFTLNKLTISLQPSLERFESQLLQLINADCHNTKQPGPEDTTRTVVIQERRLHVGVHNGWCFLDKPQVVVLEPLASGGRARADSTSKQSSLTKDSSATSSLPQTLGLRSNLDLRLTNHQALAVIFQLEYVFSAPIGRETMEFQPIALSCGSGCFVSHSTSRSPLCISLDFLATLSATSTSRAAFLQCLRWGIWCPFQDSADWKREEIQLVLQGGAKPNPHGVMVYSTETSAKTLSPVPLSASGTTQVSEAKDMIMFRLSSGLERKASSPKASLRTKQEDVSSQRRSPSSPSKGQKFPPPSPPESPQGPGAYSAVSNIAHLEMDLQPDNDVSLSAQDELQELPFTPVHAPVITLGINAPSSCSVSTRSSLAHLHSAGFPDIVDCNGQVAEVLDPTEPVTFDPQREETDPLQGNLLVFQFLAFTRIPTAGAGPDWPGNIYFTFQFYRFPPVTSQQLKLLTSDKVQQKTSDPLPCVLASINKDATVNSGSPGLQVQFRVDDGFLRPGEKRWFLRYLALHTMHIDIWDSDSLLLIGSTAIELKLPAAAGKMVHERGNAQMLHGGYPVDPSRRKAADVSPSHIITPRKVTGGFRGGTRNAAQAQRLQTDEVRVPLFRHGIRDDAIMFAEHNPNEPDDGRRKLSCMAAVHRREGKKDAQATNVTERTKEAARLTRELQQIKPCDERNKIEGIANMLSQAITTQHLLYASLGSAEYMEFVLKNPFNVAQTVTILSDDPELSVITNTEEWRYFKALTKTPTSLEENMFHLDEGAPGPRIYLRPKESIHIPLKYQSFLCDHTVALQGPSFLPTGKGSQMAKKNLSNIVAAKTIKCQHCCSEQKSCQKVKEVRSGSNLCPAKTDKPQQQSCQDASFGTAVSQHTSPEPDMGHSCRPFTFSPQVTFKTDDGKPMAICQVNVEPTPHVVDQTFRLYHPELCFLKKAIRLPPWHNPTVGDPDARTHMSVCCSDPNIICQTRMLVDPNGVFVLPPAAVQELQLKVQPWRAGSRFLYVNAVDVEHRRLVTSWLLCLNVHRPVLSKAFEVSVPVGGGRGSSRKITYINPYTSSRQFLLRSDHPDLLQFKEDKFQIGGGESYTIGLRFAASQSPGSVEILVYVNNLEEKTEETFCVKLFLPPVDKLPL
ncbi:hypothetical protein PAMP_011736 [Pampus punctatissimus]